MKILFIGGTQFIGRRAAELLVERGHDVTVFHRGKTNNPLPDSVQHIHGDLCDLDDYVDEFKALAPDVIIHMLLMQQSDSAQMMRVFRGITERVVVVSSTDVYRAWGRVLNTEPGEPDRLPLTEISPIREDRYPYRNTLNKDWRYYYDKIHVEQVATQMRKPPASVLRLPMVYGEYDYQHRIVPYLQRMGDNRPFILIDERAASWKAPRMYVDNAAHALALVATDPRADKRIYHIAQAPDKAPTERQWITAIAKAAGWNGYVVPVSPATLPQSMRTDPHGQDIVLDSSRIYRELDYQEIIGFQEGLRRTVAWNREHVLPGLPEIDYTTEDKIAKQMGL